MPAQAVSTVSESDLQKTHPIVGLVPGWFFRLKEQSAGVFLAEGRDRMGHVVAHSGTDETELLSRCVKDASNIESKRVKF